MEFSGQKKDDDRKIKFDEDYKDDKNDSADETPKNPSAKGNLDTDE